MQKCFLITQILETDKIKCNDQSYWRSLVAELIDGSYDLYCNKTITFLEVRWYMEVTWEGKDIICGVDLQVHWWLPKVNFELK